MGGHFTCRSLRGIGSEFAFHVPLPFVGDAEPQGIVSRRIVVQPNWFYQPSIVFTDADWARNDPSARSEAGVSTDSLTLHVGLSATVPAETFWRADPQGLADATASMREIRDATAGSMLSPTSPASPTPSGEGSSSMLRSLTKRPLICIGLDCSG